MKTITIIKADDCQSQTCLLDSSKKDLIITGPEDMSVSDGYHTIDELYEHRISIYIALCKQIQQADETAREYGGVKRENRVWKSKFHHDGSSFEGWFILGIGKETGSQISYHLPLSKWEETDFVDSFNEAPCEFDGHTSQDVLQRLKNI